MTPDDLVAVVGMAVRVPGAADVEAFWRNVHDGVESVGFFTAEEALADGAVERELAHPDYVRAFGALEDVESFDAEYFGITPRDARILDPQHRLFLELCDSALDDAACVPARFPGDISVYGGTDVSTYLLRHLLPSQVDNSLLELLIANDKDHLASRAAYRLGLTGAAIGVQTACSSSLVAVHLATQALLAGECDAALAGGVSITLPQRRGYLWQEGGIASRDGHCRAFSAQATGTITGNGGGIVVLKTLRRALEDHDHVRAVILGSAVNNDGSERMGYSAPTIGGQVAVITEALAGARVAPESVGLIEAHGTGTPLGDPIELEALARVFGGGRERTTAVGSVKSNIGHLDAAAGVAGFVKAALAVHHGVLPPTLHCDTPTTAVDLTGTQLYLNTKAQPWTERAPRRAGVTSLGMGGTNAHVVLQEWRAESAEPVPGSHLLPVSAKSPEALAAGVRDVVRHVRDGGDPLSAVARTLQHGRRAHRYRQAVVWPADPPGAGSSEPVTGRAVCFAFTGQGSRKLEMGDHLGKAFPAYREACDEAFAALETAIGGSRAGRVVRHLDDPDRLHDNDIAQPALVIAEYAMARLLESWGVTPDAVLGHSLGEWTAAIVAGVVGLTDGLRAVAARAALMGTAEPGAMLAVRGEVAADLVADVDLACHNTARDFVFAGTEPDIARLERRLQVHGVQSTRLAGRNAFHSRLMDPVVGPLAGELTGIALRPPEIPMLCGVTGSWLTPEDAVSAHRWARQVRSRVRFADCLDRLVAADRPWVVVEVGPGRAVTGFARRHLSGQGVPAVATLPNPGRDGEDADFLAALGALWEAGAVEEPVDPRLAGVPTVPLPVYPYQRKRYWITAPGQAEPVTAPEVPRAGTPVTDDEILRVVLESWRAVIGVDALAPDVSVFDLGVDSLTATSAAGRIRTGLGVDLSVREVLDHPTGAALAALIRNRRTTTMGD
ncbi:type I polyketide synthase [Actinosynnema sp. CS-041913]|uniref:type I polyketide synthase n=1 Tax=Actinosynnema sp. CS-041913 TaxID=3239917 RepID=UPI003D8B9D91